MRYTVRGSDIHASVECSPTEATFDVVAIPGFATATVAVFMVQLDQSNEGSLDYSTVDTLISTLRKPDSTAGQPR